MKLVKLLAGHSALYRRAELRQVAVDMHTARDLYARGVMAVLNATLLVRRLARVHGVLAFRRLVSRGRDRLARLAGRAQPAAPAKRRTLSLLCPTRGRPHNVRTFVHSVRATAAVPGRIELLFYVDDDDPALAAYARCFERLKRGWPALARCELVVGPPMSVSKSWNVLAERSSGDLLMMANDDQIYVDYAWDLTLDRACEAFPDEIVCMYFDNKRYDNEIEGLPRGDFPIVTRKWYDVLGQFTPGIFEFSCNELWILDLARRIGRTHVIPGVLVDHLHYDAYKSPLDETYLRHELSGSRAHDRELYAKTGVERLKAAVKLTRAIQAAARQGAPPHSRHVAANEVTV
jgi:glycosyl transferase/beta-hydroxylase protein BlmF